MKEKLFGKFSKGLIIGIILGFFISILVPPLYQMDNTLREMNYLIRKLFTNRSISEITKDYSNLLSSRFPYENIYNCVYEKNKDGRLSDTMVPFLLRECKRQYLTNQREINNSKSTVYLNCPRSSNCWKIRELELEILGVDLNPLL